jgi:ketosteroid isomerase-like protein
MPLSLIELDRADRLRIWSVSTSQQDADVVRRYLRTFATRDLDELRTVVADDVEMYGAGQFARGRHYVEAAVMAPGLTVVDQQVVELHSAGHRVTVAGTNTYRQDSTGKTAVQSFCKMYQVEGGKIVRFWGEADLFGLLRGLDMLPGTVLEFA